jgi:methylated-DNA-[protein]-cysteine S-methyltransferase
VGVLELVEQGGMLRELHFRSSGEAPPLETPLSPVLQLCFLELEEYFQGKRHRFTMPLYLQGTPFQIEVWRTLREIPYGETRSYQDVALAIGNPRALRAVGGANNKNPLAIIIPCHRVIGKNGSLTGFGGGLAIKEWLLEHEKQHVLKR